ncbi:MAG: DUF4332 domain-containing protein [Clostridiales bacterium]|nr:DUF4332 domain-containing protein [Clostridiales bacterium]
MMVNTDYRIDAISILMREECILKGYYPLIPYRDTLVEKLSQMGFKRKSEVLNCTDEELLRLGLPDSGTAALFRRFLTMYDPKPQKMREIVAVSETPAEAESFKVMYLLPGVKSTRARLYMRAGFVSLADIAASSPEKIMAACADVIEKERLCLKVPLMKEVRTHIAVAKAFTDAD